MLFDELPEPPELFEFPDPPVFELEFPLPVDEEFEFATPLLLEPLEFPPREELESSLLEFELDWDCPEFGPLSSALKLPAVSELLDSNDTVRPSSRPPRSVAPCGQPAMDEMARTIVDENKMRFICASPKKGFSQMRRGRAGEIPGAENFC